LGQYIIAYDLGTTACKTAAFDLEGNLVRSVDVEYGTDYRQPGWAEQNPEDWWRAVVLASREITKGQLISARDILGVSFSGQMEGCIPLDANGNPVRPAIIHLDSRAKDEAEWLKKNIGVHELMDTTGNLVDAECTLSKISWLKRNEPKSFQKARIFLSGAKDYAALKFTGSRAYTDYVDASISMLLDVNKNDWSELLLNNLGITKDNLPKLVPSATVVGEVSAEASNETGIRNGTKVVMGGGDAGCAAVGAGCVRTGDACANIGSTAWIAVVADHPPTGGPKGIYSIRHPDPKYFMAIGAVLSAGHSYRWARDQLGPWEVPKEKPGWTAYTLMDEEARSVRPGSDGLIFLPYLMGERTPYRDHYARGVLFGLSLSHKKQHMIRAVLEGVAYGLRHVIDTFQEADLEVTDMRLFGGGTKGKIWQEIMANIFNRKIMVPRIVGETTSLGAAITGAVGLGIYKDYAAAKELVRIEETVNPNASVAKSYENFYRVFLSLYPALKDGFVDLAKARENTIDER
jgi:xylulokinase